MSHGVKAAGILDVNTQTLHKLGIPRVVINSHVIKYRLADIKTYIQQNTEK
jgi:hypothetical protein